MARSLSGSKAKYLQALLLLALAACGTSPSRPPPPARVEPGYLHLGDAAQANDIVVFALGLVDTGYRFGGDNPEAGLDCSGMVSYVFERVTGTRLPHNAARIASLARPVAREQLRPGDLVFFNTLQRANSHVGLYIGDGRFIHAPSSRGRVRIDTLDNRYFAPRFEGGRTLFN